MIAHVILGFQKTHHCPKNVQIRKVGGKRGLVVLVVSNSACVGVYQAAPPSLPVARSSVPEWSHGFLRLRSAAYATHGRPRHTEA